MKKFYGILLTGIMALSMTACAYLQIDVNDSGQYSAALVNKKEETITLFAMDTYMTITTYGTGAKSALQATETRIRELENLWSVTNQDSEIYALNHGDGSPIEVNPATAKIVSFALEMADRTNASSSGKSLIHAVAKSGSSVFLETMTEAAKSVADYVGDNILYINVMNNLSVDCDCRSNPAEPDMHDIGILASLDPVALDQACVDLVYEAEDGASVVERIESINGIYTLEYTEDIGFGNRQYELVNLDA